MKSIITMLGEVAHNVAAMSPIKQSLETPQEIDCIQSNVSPSGAPLSGGSPSQPANLNAASEDRDQGPSDEQKRDLTTNGLDDTIESSFPASDPSSQTPISHIGCPVA